MRASMRASVRPLGSPLLIEPASNVLWGLGGGVGEAVPAPIQGGRWLSDR